MATNRKSRCPNTPIIIDTSSPHCVVAASPNISLYNVSESETEPESEIMLAHVVVEPSEQDDPFLINSPQNQLGLPENRYLNPHHVDSLSRRVTVSEETGECCFDGRQH
jgi:hypothetical protein